MSMNLLLAGLFGALILCAALPWVYYVKSNKSQKAGRRTIISNLVSFGTVLGCAVACMFFGSPVLAEASAASAGASGMAYLAAAISTGASCIGAGFAVAQAAAAALGAISENENLTGKSLIFVALAEGIALYGIVISIIILSKV